MNDRLERRRSVYLGILERLEADAAVLTSEAAVAHATGVNLYTQHLLPERPIAAVVGARGTRLVACDYELPQLGLEHPHLETVGFPEFGVDPWSLIAATALEVGGQDARVVVEATIAGLGVAALERAGAIVSIDQGFDGLMRARMHKDREEVDRFRDLARAADSAIAAAAETAEHRDLERDVAAAIMTRLMATVAPPVEGAAIVAARANNASMHHLATGTALTAGPVRLGLKVQVDGWWMLLTRMAVFVDEHDPAFDDDYARFIDAYIYGLRLLIPGRTGAEVHAAVRDRLAGGGLVLASLKVGHGTGLGFREPPVLRAEDATPLEPAMVLAYDFAVEPWSTRSGLTLHVEDRVLVTDHVPERLSGVADLSRPIVMRGRPG